MEKNLQENVGTPLYQSPEQIANEFYNEKVDIFAIGLILYEMCSLFKTLMERRESLENLRSNQVINDQITSSYNLETQLILKMTQRNPMNRPSAEELISSTEFQALTSEYDIKRYKN